MQNEPTMRQFNVHGAYYTMYNHSRTDEYAQAYSTRVWLSQLTQTGFREGIYNEPPKVASAIP